MPTSFEGEFCPHFDPINNKCLVPEQSEKIPSGAIISGLEGKYLCDSVALVAGEYLMTPEEAIKKIPEEIGNLQKLCEYNPNYYMSLK